MFKYVLYVCGFIRARHQVVWSGPPFPPSQKKPNNSNNKELHIYLAQLQLNLKDKPNVKNMLQRKQQKTGNDK